MKESKPKQPYINIYLINLVIMNNFENLILPSGIVQGGAECGNEYLSGIFTNLADKSILEFVKEKSGLNKSKLKVYI